MMSIIDLDSRMSAQPQIEEDRWQPSATLDSLRQRADLMVKIRDFFTQRHYLEVETPIIGQFGVTEPYLSNMSTTIQGQRYYLQTSPEYHMKRLLAAGSGPIFQIARVFRDDELGRWHNPEFTLLEWYRLNSDHFQLMDEVDLFFQSCLGCPPMIRRSYRDVFKEACNLDPFDIDLTVDHLQSCAAFFGLGDVLAKDEQDIDPYLFLLMSHVVEPALSTIRDRPVAVYHFPPTQAALSKIQNGVAERFEIYFCGVELANGFHELTDPALQAKRFETDVQVRRIRGLTAMTPDQYLLQALEYGLPPCSGVALGIDRLVTLCLEKSDISSVLAFNFERA